jgi:hypothetical protein
MKHYVSKILKIISILYMGFPVFYITGSALLFDVSVSGCGQMLLSPWYYVLSILAISVGYGFWEVKRWAWHFFLLANAMIIYANALMAFVYGESHHQVIAFLFSIAMITLLIYEVAREIRVPYFFPKIRWWESDPRYRLSVPVSITRLSGENFAADILDLSMGGCFVKLRTDVSQDERVKLSFVVFGTQLDLDGFVVWRTRSTVTHPKGVGVKFQPVNRAQKRSLRVVNVRLKKIADLYRRSRYLVNQEEFLKRLHELESQPLEKTRKNAV